MEDKLDIRHIKMINGDEILALINQNNENNLLVERPVLVMQNMMGSYQLAPWFPFTKSSLFKIYKNRIIASVGIDDSVQQQYINFVLQSDQPQAKIESNAELLNQYREIMKEHAMEEEYDYDTVEETPPETIH